MLEKTKEIIRDEIPPEFQASAMKAVKLATNSVISKFNFIIASQNQKFGQRLEQKAAEAEAEAKVDDAFDEEKAESARREAQAYRSANDEIIETLKAIDKEISKVKRSITIETRTNLPEK